MKQIIINQWKMLLRLKTIYGLTLLFVLGLALVTWLSVKQNKLQEIQQLKATKHIRNQWDNIDQMNPHAAAHFGMYTFKPINALSCIDQGITASTGNVLRLEAHQQNEISYSDASQSLMISKFGKLKPALLLQYVIPLFLIFLAFSSISTEKESGRIKLLLIQGISTRKLIISKALSIWFYGIFLLFLTLVIACIFNASKTTSDTLIRLSSLFISYALYYYIIVLLTTFFSSKLKTNTASLSSMLAIWMLWTIFLTKIAGNAVEKIYPLPSRQEFNLAIHEDRSKGMDGHIDSDQRTQAFIAKVLKKYGVEKEEDLPVNLDGLRMQADEEYGNTVWDKHFGNNYKILKQQKQAYQLSGIINPFASLQNLSMGISGNDMFHHVDYLKKAENYRRYLIKTLNDKQAYGGSKTHDWKWKESNVFYKSLKDFSYSSPTFLEANSYYTIDFILLFLWVIILSALVWRTSNKIKIL